MNILLDESDKVYWHHYTEFYEEELEFYKCKNILEFGVWKGASICWLMDRYPLASIHGADILDVQASWPQEDRVKYFQVDQGDIHQIRGLFQDIGESLDLVIEDGSHIPVHQRNCLIEGIRHMSRGGIYILEDIHTSHPSHPYYKQSKKLFRQLVGSLHLLLAIDHLKNVGEELSNDILYNLAKNSLFSKDDVNMLYAKISSIKIYKRSKLPYKCFSCGESKFNYSTLKCKCGISLYSETDSMSALIRLN